MLATVFEHIVSTVDMYLPASHIVSQSLVTHAQVIIKVHTSRFTEGSSVSISLNADNGSKENDCGDCMKVPFVVRSRRKQMVN